jgi:hypothetical protein
VYVSLFTYPISLLISSLHILFQVLTLSQVENRLVQECAQPDNRHDDPNSWYMLTSTSIRMVIDGAGHPFIVNLNKGVLDQYHGYDIYKFGPHVLTVEFSGRETFKYGEQSWDEFTRKNGHSAWCEQEQWSKGPLDCMKDKSTKSYRVS